MKIYISLTNFVNSKSSVCKHQSEVLAIMSSITHSITKSMFDCSGLITMVRNIHYISESAVGIVGFW